MGIEIKMSGMEISGNSKVLDNAVIKNNEDINISLQDSKISEHASVLSDLEIENVLEELNHKTQSMDKSSKEYLEICEILEMQTGNKKELFKCITSHLGEFSQGVLASVIANLITKV